jgi:hypothetical protein
MTKWKGQIASAAPAMLFATVSAVALSAGMGVAQAQEVISTSTPGPVILDIEFDHTITVDGSVHLSSHGAVVTIDGDYSNEFTNNGTIEASGTYLLQATGLYGDGGLLVDGSIVNSGTIDVSVESEEAKALGISFDEGNDGAIVNSGTINVAAFSTSDYDAYGVGIHIGGPIGETGSIENSGTITVSADSSSTATAYGIHVDEDNDGAIANSGTINVAALSTDDEALGLGIVVDGSIAETGSIGNSGTINVSAEGSDFAAAAGINVNEGYNDGAIVNSGTINVAVLSTVSEAYGGGINVNGFVGETGSIDNSGTISVSAEAYYSAAVAAGINIERENDGAITNSGTINIAALSTNGYAIGYGIAVRDSVSETGSIENSGTINVSAEGSESATAYGIHIDDNNNGAILNSGTINVETLSASNYDVYPFLVPYDYPPEPGFSESSNYAYGVGIKVNGSVGETGSIENSGTISVSAEASSYATVMGIHVDGDNEGAIVNSGTIAIEAISTDYYATGYGIKVDGSVSDTGTIENSGTISVSAEGYYTASADGIYVREDNNGAIVNSGTIAVEAVSTDDYATGYGIRVRGDVGTTGSIENTGTISVTAITTDESTASAYGVYIGDNLDGSFTNTGMIDVLASAQNTYYATAVGVYVGDDLNGSISNSGTISATAQGGTDTASAVGVWLDGDIGATGSLVNTGTITATAIGGTESDAEAYGIYLEGTAISGSTITNSGTVNAFANHEESTASAYGIYLDGTVEAGASVLNTGTINATANAATYYATATGVYIDTLDGEFSNLGTINASAMGYSSSSEQAYGLYVNNFNGEITNAGTITATASDTDNAVAIYLGSGTGTLNLTSDDTITGLISVAAHDVNLTANGVSSVFTFEDRNTQAGDFVTAVSSDSFAWYVSDEGGSYPVYASVNAADIITSSGSVASLGGLMNGLSAPLGSAGVEPTVSRNRISFGADGGTTSLRPFVSATVSSTDYEGVDGANDSDAVVADATFGYAGLLQSGLGISAAAGLFTSEGSSGPSDFNSQGFFGGVTLGQNFGNFAIESGFGFGLLSTDNTRSISGSSDAEASFDSTFTTMHVGVSRNFDVSNNMTLEGFGNLRYTRQDVDGYTETGSTANATVADHVVATTEAKIGVEAAYMIDTSSTLTGALTVVSRKSSGDYTIDVTVFGSTAPLASAAADFSGAGIALGYEYAFAESSKLTLGAQTEFGDGGTGPSISAGIKWSF